MTTKQIIETAAKAAKEYKEGDFYIGCSIDEVLPNKNKSTLICVDCSWLKPGQQAIVDLDEVVAPNKAFDTIQLKMDGNELTFEKWVDMVDDDGDTHHCKIVSYVESSDDIFNPIDVDSIDWVIYVEL